MIVASSLEAKFKYLADGAQRTNPADLRSSHGFGLVAARNRGLSCGKTGDGNAVGRARHVIHADAIAELDRTRVAAVLATDTDVEVVAGLAAQFDPSFNQLADTL